MSKKDMVNRPNHYIGEFGLEVEDVLQNFMPRYEDSYVSHRVASAIEYLLRSPRKNGREDIEKAHKNLSQVLDYYERIDEKEEEAKLDGHTADEVLDNYTKIPRVGSGAVIADKHYESKPGGMYTNKELEE